MHGTVNKPSAGGLGTGKFAQAGTDLGDRCAFVQPLAQSAAEFAGFGQLLGLFVEAGRELFGDFGAGSEEEVDAADAARLAMAAGEAAGNVPAAPAGGRAFSGRRRRFPIPH
jgi:hypothetical protein